MITVFVDKIKLWYNLKVANNFFNFFGMEEENERKVNSPDNNTSDSFESLEVSEEIKAAKEEVKRLEAEIEVATAEFLAQKDKIETIQKDIENGNHEGKNLEKKQKIIQKIEEAMLLTKERIDRLKIKLEFKKELAESIGIERVSNTIGKKAYCEKKEIEDNITSIIGEGYKSEVTINSEILKKAGFSYVEFGASEGIRTSAVASIRKSKDGAFLIKTGTSWYRVKFDNMDGIEVVESGNDLLSEKDKELKKSIENSLHVVEVNYSQGEEKIKSFSPELETTKSYEIRLKSFLKRKNEILEKISPTDKNRKPDISQAILDEADALSLDFIDFLNELFKPNKKEKSKDGSNEYSAGDSKEGDNSREMINAHIGELLANSKKEINNFDKKLQDFKKAFPEFKKIISGLEDKRNEFISLLNEVTSIDNDSRTQKDVVKLNQAYDKFYLLTRKNWEEEYKKRRSNREDNQKEEKEDALIKMEIENIRKKSRELIDKLYVILENAKKRGDKICIDNDGDIMELEEAVIKDFEKQIEEDDPEDLKVTLKDIESYIKVAEEKQIKESIDGESDNTVINELKDLSEEELGLTPDNIKSREIEEKFEKIDGKVALLRKRFKDFVLQHKEEWEFNRELLKEMHLIIDDWFALRKSERNEEDLEKLEDLSGEIDKLIEGDWEEELRKYREEKVNTKEKKENIFTPEEMEDIEKLKNYIEKFRAENLDGEPVWQKMSELGKKELLKALILNAFEKVNIFSDKNEDEITEIIENILNDKKI